MKGIEKIASYARLGWEGVLITTGAMPCLFFVDDARAKMFGIFLAAFGALSYKESFNSYRRTLRSIQEHGDLDKRVIEPQLRYHCNRQGARTAAAEYGLDDRFDEIMKDYKGRKDLEFIPHF